MKLVFDIEANNLLPKISKFHCAGVPIKLIGLDCPFWGGKTG